MSHDPLELTGTWDGLFRYPGREGPDTPFLCKFVETHGAFSGWIIEPDTYHATARTLSSMVSGHRGGRAVDFTKSYRGQRYGYENPVDYVGLLSADGLTITGSWSLLDSDGTFEMHREAAAEQAKAAEVAEEVSLGAR